MTMRANQAPPTPRDPYEHALTGVRCWIRSTSGRTHQIPMSRWIGAPPNPDDAAFDSSILDLCGGQTIDIGCGPGRLAAGLVRRGIPTLGIDVSAAAVAVTRRRGAPALVRSMFDPVPGVGRWSCALLADGNIGIGGDPLKTLKRTRQILGPQGVAVVEFEPSGSGLRRSTIRLETAAAVGEWFAWASVGVECAPELAALTGFRVETISTVGGRPVAVLRRL